MSEPKTKPTGIPIADFLNAIPDERVRQDCWTIAEMMQAAAQSPGQMWGTSIVGFGQYRVVDARGKGTDWMQIGFSPRKQAITLYLWMGGLEHSEEMLAKLGKYTRGKGCLYIKRLSDVDLTILKEMVRESVDYANARPGAGLPPLHAL